MEMRALTKSNDYNDLKARVHDRLLDLLDLSLLEGMDEFLLRREIKKVTEKIISEDKLSLPFNLEERDRFTREIQDEVLGLGPIEPFMHDPTITDVLVNTYRRVYVERFGKLHPTEAGSRMTAILER